MNIRRRHACLFIACCRPNPRIDPDHVARRAPRDADGALFSLRGCYVAARHVHTPTTVIRHVAPVTETQAHAAKRHARSMRGRQSPIGDTTEKTAQKMRALRHGDVLSAQVTIVVQN